MNAITATADGSNTLFNPQIGENYHSRHGAVQESRHVFIDAGLRYAMQTRPSVHILEIGFGTGLNFLLSAAEAADRNCELTYTALETHPLAIELIDRLEYHSFVPDDLWSSFSTHYHEAFTQQMNISGGCRLRLIQTAIQDFSPLEQYDVVYYDAFSARHQPEMWTDAVIRKTADFLKPGGIFVTYAITGDLKRTLKSAGFNIEKLPGAPGKREMLRAIKR